MDARFLLAKDGTVRFSLGKYDHNLALVIDPVFVFSTYLGGTGADVARAITTDAKGDIYLTGYTHSNNFPVSHSEQATNSSCCNSAFVSKIDPTGTTLIYSTYLGGSNEDAGDGIAVDGSGNAIVAGYTESSDFPHAGAITAPPECGGSICYFLTSLSSDGSMLNYSGAAGGQAPGGPPWNEPAIPVAVDKSGDAYFAGLTYDPEFQITPGTLASSVEGYPQPELFVLKTGATGEIVYASVVPGNASYDSEVGYANLFSPSGLAVDGSGNVTATGTAGLGLPTTAGVLAPEFPNDPAQFNYVAGYILQLNATASAINFASYLPGTDRADAIAVDQNGNYWIAGTTRETTLPVGQNAYMKSPTFGSYTSVSTTGYILEISPGATAAVNGTYLDGTGANLIWESSEFTALALDSHSNVFAGGITSSADFPMQNPFVTEYESGGSVEDLILAEMSPDLSRLEFGSFLSSTDSVDDIGTSGSLFANLAIDTSDNLIVGKHVVPLFSHDGERRRATASATGESTIGAPAHLRCKDRYVDRRALGLSGIVWHRFWQRFREPIVLPDSSDNELRQCSPESLFDLIARPADYRVNELWEYGGGNFLRGGCEIYRPDHWEYQRLDLSGNKC